MQAQRLPMSNHQTAQAVRLIDALQDQLDKMTVELAWIERQDVTARSAQACAMRMEATALRRDIQEAQFLIDRLQRRYLNGDEQIQASRYKKVRARSVYRSCRGLTGPAARL